MASCISLYYFRIKIQIIRQLLWKNLNKLVKLMLFYQIQKRNLNMIDMGMNLHLNKITSNNIIKEIHRISIIIQHSNNSISFKGSLISRKDSLNFRKWAIFTHFSIMILIHLHNSMTFSKMIHFSNKTFSVIINLKMQTITLV